MIKLTHLAPNACINDPVLNTDKAYQVENETDAVRALASDALIRIAEWITREGQGTANRALRTDIVILAIGRHLLPCQRPSAAWIARQHGVSRQRTSQLWREFAEYTAPYLQFHGQWFLNRRRAG
jgi:hypothetical protein